MSAHLSDPLDLDQLMTMGAAALEVALDGSHPGLPDEVELRIWDPDLAVRHRQHFVDGRFVAWTRDAAASELAIDLVCTARELGALLGLPADRPTLADFRLRHSGTGAIEPPPPFDSTTTGALHRTPLIPDASCVVGLHFADTPFGPSDVTVDITDGQPTITIGAPEVPEVVASLRFDLILRYMAGDLGLMDTLTGGTVTGEWPLLMFLAGTIESPEFQTAIEPARDRFRYLADVVQILSTHEYRTALKDTAATEPRP